MKDLQSRYQVLQLLFAGYPDEAGFFLTSDNQAFTEKHKIDADNHAKTLENKTVDWVKTSKIESKTKQSEADPERAGLITRFTELFGKAPGFNIKTETLKTKVAEKEVETK